MSQSSHAAGGVLVVDHEDGLACSGDGPTATEYAVMLALIIVVCIAAISALGSRVNEVFNSAKESLPTD